MAESEAKRELGARFGDRLVRGFPLAELTSFHIGGPADLMLAVEDEQELCDALEIADRCGLPVFHLGAGTNLLVSDRGVRGLVIRLGKGFERIDVMGTRIVTGAAASFGTLVEFAVKHGLAGLEFGEGIPGSVGGAIAMNAGAFGGEIASVVNAIHGVGQEGKRRSFDREEAGFAYRRSGLPSGFVVTMVDFELKSGDCEALQARVNELKAKRAARQPGSLPNAGSIFKNPPGKFAGRLLEAAGIKGMRRGGAAFSEQHANFIVNIGGARAEDVRALIELARNRVRERAGVTLEPEVRLVGDW